jgi:aryl-alcohol dehydrogenase-like predicted oxidoreductase
VPWRWSHASLERAVRASCKRLQVSSIPIYLLHSPIHCWRPIEYWVQSVAICKQKGLVQTMGLSNCNANQVQRAVQAGKEVSLAYVLLLRVYNILLNVIPHDIL